MSDISEQLRDCVNRDDLPDWKLVLDAASRIEKLEAALREIIIHCDVPAPPNAEALKMFARKALEDKQ